MFKRILKFLAVAVILAVLFWLPKCDWLEFQNKFQATADQSPHQSDELLDAWADDSSAVSADSASLTELFRFISDGELAVRLQQWSDSVIVIERQLESYRELFYALREILRAEGLSGPSELRMPYFRAVRRLRSLEEQSRRFNARLDTLRSLITAIEIASQHKAKTFRVNLRRPKPETARWLVPTQIPIRQACLSCHLPQEGGRVILFTGEEVPGYPQAMLQHPPDEFGCTSCHRGEPESLDFERAHGNEAMGRPFLPGKLALRSCGLCHTRATVHWDIAGLLPWPEDCLACHENDRLEELKSDSSRRAFADSLADEQKLRAWLLKHWSNKAGRLPERERFEQAVSLLTPAGQEGESKPDSSAGPEEKTAAYRCPFCGREFEVLRAVANPVCPADGTALLPAEM